MSGLSEQRREELRDWWDDGGDFSVDDWGPATLFPIVARMIADAYARGAAEQAAKVEAVLEKWGLDFDGFVGYRAVAAELRAALASEGTDALAKVRADAVRKAADDMPDSASMTPRFWLRDHADRIEAGDAQ